MVIPAVGISLAIMQWLTLRRHLSQAGWWVLATLVGWFLGVAFVMTGVGVVIGDWLEYGLVGNVITFGIIGLALGITQWLILRRQVLQAGWWILASLAGWVVLALAVGKAITNKAELAEVGAIPAVITGFVLVWLLRQPVSEV